MTNESKRKDDEKTWRTFLDMYIERLKKENDGDIEKLNIERIKIMKQNNPRYEFTVLISIGKLCLIISNFNNSSLLRFPNKKHKVQNDRALSLSLNPFIVFGNIRYNKDDPINL